MANIKNKLYLITSMDTDNHTHIYAAVFLSYWPYTSVYFIKHAHKDLNIHGKGKFTFFKKKRKQCAFS